MAHWRLHSPPCACPAPPATQPGDVSVSYLPAWHAYGRTLECVEDACWEWAGGRERQPGCSRCCPAPRLRVAAHSLLSGGVNQPEPTYTNPAQTKPLPRSYYLLSRGVKLFYSTLMGLKGDLAEQQVGGERGIRSRVVSPGRAAGAPGLRAACLAACRPPLPTHRTCAMPPSTAAHLCVCAVDAGRPALQGAAVFCCTAEACLLGWGGWVLGARLHLTAAPPTCMHLTGATPPPPAHRPRLPAHAPPCRLSSCSGSRTGRPSWWTPRCAWSGGRALQECTVGDVGSPAGALRRLPSSAGCLRRHGW